MLIYDLVFRDSIVMAYSRKLISILAPILYGFAMAYLLAPIVNWFERAIFRRGGSKATPTAKTLLFIVNPRAGRTRSMGPLFEAVAHFGQEGFLMDWGAL